MKSINICILACILVSACAHTPPPGVPFPDVPEKLMAAPDTLKPISQDSITTINKDDETDSKKKLSEVSAVITKNYTVANRIRAQLIELQEWVAQQKAVNP